MDLEIYNHIRSGGSGFYEQKRGLIAVWGKEAVQFLDGMVSNDMKTLADGEQMLAAFPNAQGRLLALVRVLRQGDRFLIETEEATREKVFNNLFRFTYAGDFFVEDLSQQYRYFDCIGDPESASQEEGSLAAFRGRGGWIGVFIEGGATPQGVQITDEVFEVLRVESGVPRYDVDMDENTVVPELGVDGVISYNKGCYIGQEIIARIHFRGHVAKRLAGLIFDVGVGVTPTFGSMDLVSAEGKPAGRITSVAYSPTLGKAIALAYVRHDFLTPGTELRSDGGTTVVTELPFIEHRSNQHGSN